MLLPSILSCLAVLTTPLTQGFLVSSNAISNNWLSGDEEGSNVCDGVAAKLAGMQTQIAELLAKFEELRDSLNGIGGSGNELNPEGSGGQLSPSQEVTCPANFTKLSSGCYKIIRKEVNWQNAATRCISEHRQAHLVVIGSKAEQDAIDKMLSDRPTGYISAVKKFWTAGQRIDPLVNSKFVWKILRASGDVNIADVTYTNWGEGEPNNHANVVEGCLEIVGQGSSYKWNDVPCHLNKFPLCEIDL
jgi:hypothetical protein